ncbi:hypothetical protein [Variovorax sp. JS1663]|uniref:hypothetical protein n=1 Tax=Variovorax sp. JS1663 TaxID=1851577 RepID=UPI000B341343|nr:hypothetical protein [Variovorax sp. JS1663]OUL98768.1 hypothetical protein A8M77_29950 [Variovorax sp. JS1663]
MSLYQRQAYGVWYYEFKVAGERYRASTKTTDRSEALTVEAQVRAELEHAAAKREVDAVNAFQSRRIWDVAESWLARSASALKDHKNNVSRIRKLFGREMRLVGETWTECTSGRYGLPINMTIRELTAEVVEELKAARIREGQSPATIAREESLVRMLIEHANDTNNSTEGDDRSRRVQTRKPSHTSSQKPHTHAHHYP